MPTMRDMIRRKGNEVYSILPDAPVYEALTIMAKHNVGALMVISGTKVEGILSERDCVRKVELEGKAVKIVKVSEIMTRNLISVQAGQELEECMSVMIEKNIRHLPVFDGNDLLGLISIRDVLREVVEVQKVMIAQLEHYIHGDGR
ncbi:MAG: CBS domain-containing protein [Anaerolineales bacterium]|nr:CBS domain-containing protein [Anaerolineales bacterium]